MLVLMNAFAGQLRACLMVKNEVKKINSMADIAATPYLKVYLLKDSSISRYMKVNLIKMNKNTLTLRQRI
ncbi:hypothetical protein HPB48_015449 [Haemaphysalis longicornis]|uniref:Uncharacterized protein n=1 Tax=Haemaphysalis longicornis TaxID=44386 RepID=A0A9J6GGQ2_HAELO|nr:hypothetical protein HPB48_015449 [Haemaphysalis longicornis]